MDTKSPDHLSAVDWAEKAPSPRPNKSFSFVREPPDGCEKVKIVDEPRSVLLEGVAVYCLRSVAVKSNVETT